MNDEQFAEMYAMNLFNQDETAGLWANVSDPPTKRTWHGITKKERNRYRRIADDILEEIK